jgi:hypothetical protein
MNKDILKQAVLYHVRIRKGPVLVTCLVSPVYWNLGYSVQLYTSRLPKRLWFHRSLLCSDLVLLSL